MPFEVCNLADDNYTPLKIHNTKEQRKIHNWLQKNIHGNHLKEINNESIDKQISNLWLTRGNLFKFNLK